MLPKGLRVLGSSLLTDLRGSSGQPGGKAALLANTGWMLLDRGFRLLIAVLVGAWVARYLGPVAYGELAYVLALLVLLQAACALGLDGPAVREIAQDRQHAPAVLGSALRLRIGAGAAGWLAAILAMHLLRPGDLVALTMIAIAGASLVFQPALVVDLWLRSESRSRVSIPFRLAAYCVVALGKICLIFAGAPLWLFAAGALAEGALVAIALALAYRRWPCRTSWSWDGARARRLLAESWPFLLSAVSISVYMRIDQIMLRELANEHELGLYSAVIPISQVWHMFPMTLFASVLPRFAQLRHQNPDQYRRRLGQMFTVMTWGGIATSTVTVVLAPLIVAVLLGPHYESAIPVLQWHAVSNVFVFMGLAQSIAIVSESTPRIALYKTLIGAAVSAGANILLTPRWGAIGAAWAAIAAYLCSAVLSNVFLSPAAFRMQLRSFNPFRDAIS
jgi:PST family polysaccharide transporter